MGRRGIHFLSAGLILLLAACCAVPFDWPGIHDAVTLEKQEGFMLELPFSSVVLEPVAGPARAFMLGPAIRREAWSWLAWAVFLGAASEAARLLLRRKSAGIRASNPARRIGTSIMRAGFPPALAALLLLGAAAFPHLPGYRLKALDSDVVLADFHTHTFHSDGWFSPSFDVDWHRMNGFDAVAVTDPHTHAGVPEAIRAADAVQGMTVLSGEERRYPGAGYFIVLGLPEILDTDPLPSITRLAQFVRSKPHTALISCPCIRHVNRIPLSRIFDCGFDAVESYNHGWQPGVRNRAEILDAVGAYQDRPCVASIDWHGKGMGAKCWTAIRIPGLRGIADHGERAKAVIDAVRADGSRPVRPIVIGAPGPASDAAVIFAPFVTAAEYLLGLRPSQLTSWAAWIILFNAVLAVTGAGTDVRRAARQAAAAVCAILAAMLFSNAAIITVHAASAPVPMNSLPTAALFSGAGFMGLLMAWIAAKPKHAANCEQ